jgi:CspA family cold shock protein
MTRGTIKRLFGKRGLGFITTEQGEDIFFHRSKLQGVDYDSLREGQEVEFEVRRAFGGRPQAVNVRLAQAKAE